MVIGGLSFRINLATLRILNPVQRLMCCGLLGLVVIKNIPPFCFMPVLLEIQFLNHHLVFFN